MKHHKVSRELSFGGELFSKYHSGFKVIFEISFGKYRILIRRGGYFLSIDRVLRLFIKYNKVNRELSFGGVVIFLVSFGFCGFVLKYHEEKRENSLGGEVIL